MKFKPATKSAARLRMALIGPAGAGKTYSALSIGTRLGKRVAVIDSEHGSASKYASGAPFTFDTLELESFAPATYVEAIKLAEREGYDVIVIDSLSHAWMGKDGALEQVDNAAKRSRSGNSFAAWREVTPQHNALVEAMLGSKCHIIATMRAKVEWVIEENERGKKEPRKIGLAPVQRDGLDYEFDVTGDIDHSCNLVIDKTRCPALKGKVFNKPAEGLANILKAWLSDGAPVREEPPRQPPVHAPTEPAPPLEREPGEDDEPAVEKADRDMWDALEKELCMQIDHAPSRVAVMDILVTAKNHGKKGMPPERVRKVHDYARELCERKHPKPSAGAAA